MIKSSPASSFPRPHRTRLDRRGFLATTSAALLAVAACSNKPTANSIDQAPADQAATVTRLLQKSPFYIAHRGGDRNWPEMTAYAYGRAAALPGLMAIEISVCLSSDGVLVCSHDPSTLRTTGVGLEIRRQPWSVLKKLEVTAAYTLNPDQPSRPLSRLDEVVEKHVDRLVMFVEPKTPEAVDPLMRTMMSFGQPERVVWKQPVNQPNFGLAKQNGFSTWGYVLDEPNQRGDRLKELAASPDIDMLGACVSYSDATVAEVVNVARQNGKKTIMWPIGTAGDRSKGLRLGCEGMMTSNVVQVPAIPL